MGSAKVTSIEFVRNGVEIDHNLFDFDVNEDVVNLISSFGKGPASFHDNLVSNLGRGVIWINEVFDHLEIRNNFIIARTSATPRTDGLSIFLFPAVTSRFRKGDEGDVNDVCGFQRLDDIGQAIHQVGTAVGIERQLHRHNSKAIPS